MKRRKQDAGRRGNAAIEAEFSDNHIAGQRFGIDDAHCAKQGERNGQIIVGSFLGQVSRRKIDCDPLGRERKAHCRNRSVNPLSALGNGLVGKADDRKFRIAGGDLTLDLDTARLKAEVGNGLDSRNHQSPAGAALLLTISAKHDERFRR